MVEEGFSLLLEVEVGIWWVNEGDLRGYVCRMNIVKNGYL